MKYRVLSICLFFSLSTYAGDLPQTFEHERLAEEKNHRIDDPKEFLREAVAGWKHRYENKEISIEDYHVGMRTLRLTVMKDYDLSMEELSEFFPIGKAGCNP